MPVVQKLYDACEESFSANGPVSEEDLEKIRAILGVWVLLLFFAYQISSFALKLNFFLILQFRLNPLS
jgi:hypothetical protein